MSFKVPAKQRDRIAVAKLLALALPGLAVLTWLMLQSIFNVPVEMQDGTLGESASSLSQWGIDVEHLLLVIPFGAAVVLFARLVVGVDAFGIFTPMLLALALIQMGPLIGLLLLGGAMLLGRLVVPVLERLNQPRMGMMAVTIGLVVIALYVFVQASGGDVSVTTFPVVVTALVVERWWVTRVSEGQDEASYLLLMTAILAVTLQFVLVAPTLKSAVENFAIAVPIAGTLLCFGLGMYRGLRLSELMRFRPILVEPDERSWD